MTTQHAEAGIPHDSLANRLGLARKHAGHLSIRAAAAKCGLGRGAWQNWEHGLSEPRATDLVTISETLGVNHEWLARGGPLAHDRGPDGGATVTHLSPGGKSSSRCTQPSGLLPSPSLVLTAA